MTTEIQQRLRNIVDMCDDAKAGRWPAEAAIDEIRKVAAEADALIQALQAPASTPETAPPIEQEIARIAAGAVSGAKSEGQIEFEIAELVKRAAAVSPEGPHQGDSLSAESLLIDWRYQDQILQQIAAIVGDEHVSCAGDVLDAVRAFAQEKKRAAASSASAEAPQSHDPDRQAVTALTDPAVPEDRKL